MSTHNENFCLKCPAETNCCRNLDNLKVSRAEYEDLFADISDEFECTDNDQFLMLSAKHGTCPHWDQGCTVYERRPMECRLYPHTLGRPRQLGFIEIFPMYVHYGCPWADRLVMSVTQAKEMIRDWLWPTSRIRLVVDVSGIVRLRKRLRKIFA